VFVEFNSAVVFVEFNSAVVFVEFNSAVVFVEFNSAVVFFEFNEVLLLSISLLVVKFKLLPLTTSGSGGTNLSIVTS
jgi:hypothetical protein